MYWIMNSAVATDKNGLSIHCFLTYPRQMYRCSEECSEPELLLDHCTCSRERNRLQRSPSVSPVTMASPLQRLI